MTPDSEWSIPKEKRERDLIGFTIKIQALELSVVNQIIGIQQNFFEVPRPVDCDRPGRIPRAWSELSI